jgi:hypothetical protein
MINFQRVKIIGMVIGKADYCYSVFKNLHRGSQRSTEIHRVYRDKSSETP